MLQFQLLKGRNTIPTCVSRESHESHEMPPCTRYIVIDRRRSQDNPDRPFLPRFHFRAGMVYSVYVNLVSRWP